MEDDVSGFPDQATEEEFDVDFEILVSPDQKEATVNLKSAEPLSSEDLICVLELWVTDMKKRLLAEEVSDATRTDSA